MAPPLASTKKLTRKPSFAGWLEAAVVNGLNGGHGQLDVDGLLPEVLTNCLEGNEAEVVADTLRLPTSSIRTDSSSSDDTGSAIKFWKINYVCYIFNN